MIAEMGKKVAVSFLKNNVITKEGQGSLNCSFCGSVYTLPVLAVLPFY